MTDPLNACVLCATLKVEAANGVAVCPHCDQPCSLIVQPGRTTLRGLFVAKGDPEPCPLCVWTGYGQGVGPGHYELPTNEGS